MRIQLQCHHGQLNEQCYNDLKTNGGIPVSSFKCFNDKIMLEQLYQIELCDYSYIIHLIFEVYLSTSSNQFFYDFRMSKQCCSMQGTLPVLKVRKQCIL